VLDGKALRQDLSKGLPQDAQRPWRELHKGARIARQMKEAGLIAIGAFMAPTEESRARRVYILGPSAACLVPSGCAASVCQERDPSGLYAATRKIPAGRLVSL